MIRDRDFLVHEKFVKEKIGFIQESLSFIPAVKVSDQMIDKENKKKNISQLRLIKDI